MPGYQEPVPVVFCGLFPATHNQFEDLRTALQKLALNDSSFTFEPETSDALGFGFRCGFLGMLHMEIVQQRLERESNLSLVQTAPNVTYEILTRKGETLHISNPTRIPDAGEIEEFREPVARVNFLLPVEIIGAIMQLCEDRRGTYLKTEYITPTRAILSYELPLAEMIYDLYDKLKSATRGYGTMDYEVIGYRAGDLCRLDILVAGAAGRCALDRRPPRARRPAGPEAGQEAQGRDRAAPVRGRDPGGDRQPGDRPRDDLGAAQERDGQVLRRRHHAEAEAAREAKGRQEADETGRERRDLAGGVPVGPRRLRGVTRPVRSGDRRYPACEIRFRMLLPTSDADSGVSERVTESGDRHLGSRLPWSALPTGSMAVHAATKTDSRPRALGGGRRQTVESGRPCAEHPAVPHVRGRGVHRADRVDGPDAAGRASRDRLPELRRSLFVVGIDEEGRAGRRSARTAARVATSRAAPAVACSGDRVLVQKFLYDFRRPQRWEVAVFHFPGEPTQAYVKRVVGPAGRIDPDRPGRRLRRRPDRPQVAARAAGDADPGLRQPLRAARRRPIPALGCSVGAGHGARLRAAGSPSGPRFVHTAPESPSAARPIDWIEYRHWDPSAAATAPVSDFFAYNGGELPGRERGRRPDARGAR